MTWYTAVFFAGAAIGAIVTSRFFVMLGVFEERKRRRAKALRIRADMDTRKIGIN